MTRRPPSSPLFPSPPLSRSLEAPHQARLPRDEARRSIRPDDDPRINVSAVRFDPPAPVVPGDCRHNGGWRIEANGGHVEDRKSTRLNSSHGYISDAAFCLKKKLALSDPQLGQRITRYKQSFVAELALADTEVQEL